MHRRGVVIGANRGIMLQLSCKTARRHIVEPGDVVVVPAYFPWVGWIIAVASGKFEHVSLIEARD